MINTQVFLAKNKNSIKEYAAKFIKKIDKHGQRTKPIVEE
jgi:hypothetical protein